VILVVDNYDSFTFNLVQALAASGATVECVRNDALSVAELLARRPAGLVLSPGPGGPLDAGISLDLLARAPDDLPILGVCLGHQCLVTERGGRVVRAREPVHGRTSRVHHDGAGLMRGLPSPFAAARYHSLVAERSSLPPALIVSAWTEEGEVMGVREVARPRFGVQFHPESFLTSRGTALLARFTGLCGEPLATGGVA
jgi:anthranilate synthase component 2